MSVQAIQEHPMTNTHLLVQAFDYWEPGSVQDAMTLLQRYGERAQVLAGGSYLLVQIKMERQAPEHLINVQKLPGLTGVSWQADGLHLGPCNTIYATRRAPEVLTHYPALADACAAFGSIQIQMMGTLGGNLCNGSPASDAVPALMALDAQLRIAGPGGERALPVEDFLLGPGQVALRPGELLTGIVLPPHPRPLSLRERGEKAPSPPWGEGWGEGPRPNVGSAFIKISRVAADLAKVSAAAMLVRDGDRILDCRLALGAVAPTVMRAPKAEALLVGQPFSPELALEAGRLASAEVAPIDDVRSTAWYRREVVKAVVHDVLQVAWRRAEQRTQAQPAGAETTWPERETPTALHVPRDQQHEIFLAVNGEPQRLRVAPDELLLNVLRERLALTGAKYGCGIGECGACTVHLNGRPALACLTLAVAVDGAEVLTVEGLQDRDGALDPLQEAFLDHQAFQCGYCTPGMLMMTKSLLKEIPAPSEEEVREYLRGNRCRCTGFASITRAVLSCAQEQEE